MRTLFALLTETDRLSENYLKDHMEYELFRPLMEIRDIEAAPEIGREQYRYTKENIIKIIQFIAFCYSKESPYMKVSDTIHFTKNKVCDDLYIDDDLRRRIIGYMIPELDECIKRYIQREVNEYVREFMIIRDIMDRNLNAASSAIDIEGNIDVKMQAIYFDNYEKFKDKLHKVKQVFNDKNSMLVQFTRDLVDNVKSCRMEDLIP